MLGKVVYMVDVNVVDFLLEDGSYTTNLTVTELSNKAISSFWTKLIISPFFFPLNLGSL